jgi:chlorobactene glucosyltransferase
MAYLILSCAWLALVAWLIARAIGQRRLFGRVKPLPALPAEQAPHVAIIVPVRNESANVRACLQSLLAQCYPAGRFCVLVVDDESTDDTARIVAAMAEQNVRLSLLRSPPLPPGWVGKSHACWIGAAAAPAQTRWLCFLDADVRAAPALLASAIRTAGEEGIDLLSLMPRQELRSFAERLILPCGLFVLAFWQDLRRRQAKDSADATATGQFMLIRREAYAAAGGHAAVAGAICEDVALARLIKRRGHKVVLRSGDRLLSARMYTGWQTLWPGLTKNLVEILGGPSAALATALLSVPLAWAVVIVPAVDGVGCLGARDGAACVALAPALVASAATLGLHLAGAIHFRIPVWYGLLFPVGYTVGALMVLDSVRRRWRGRVSWKGRSYQP